MCGGGSTNQTTQAVTIPPNVLARYDAVNAKASAAAETPFQKYEGEFVAPVNAQQQAGMSGTDRYANFAQPTYQEGIGLTRTALNQAQPYIDSATGQLMNAQSQAQPYIYGATGQLMDAQGQGQAGINQAANQYGTAANRYGTAESTYGNAYSGAQPYQAGATNAAMAGMQAVNPTGLGAAQIGQFMDPYLGTVVGNTAKLLNQQNQQAQAGQLGSAIKSGAFGGDRAGIAAANLAQQQGLAAGSTLGGLLSQGYGQALSAAQQQQGVSLGAAQANRAAMQQGAGQLQSIGQQGYSQGMGLGQAQQGIGGAYQGLGGAQAALGQQAYGMGAQTAQQLAALGQQQYGMGAQTSQQLAALGQQQYGMTSGAANQIANLGMGAQTAGLQGAQAQLTAGQIAQQTQQAQDTALYNQHLMEASYPFQVAQFEANVAEGTGGLSGSTTTTNQPGGFFSDRRLKENVKEIGKTFDGQPIYSYRYKDGDPRTQIGLMAQDVEKKHPDAVGSSAGYRTVDYGKATEDAADRGHFYSGGVVPTSEGGHVGFEHMGEGYANGGMPILPGLGSADMQALLQAQAQMYAPFGEGGLYGSAASGAPGGGSSYVPQANLPVTRLTTAGELPAQESALSKAKKWSDLAQSVTSTYETGKKDWEKYKTDKAAADLKNPHASGGLVGHYAAGGGMPYGGGLDIPTSGAPAPQLAIAGPISAQSTGLDKLAEVASIADSATNIASGLNKDDKTTKHNRGGLVGHYGDGGVANSGGMPYGQPDAGMAIPNEKAETTTLATPGAVPEQETGLDKTKKVADIAKTAMTVAAMAGLARGGTAGGRKGYATDGSVGDIGIDDNAFDETKRQREMAEGAISAPLKPPYVINPQETNSPTVSGPRAVMFGAKYPTHEQMAAIAKAPPGQLAGTIDLNDPQQMAAQAVLNKQARQGWAAANPPSPGLAPAKWSAPVAAIAPELLRRRGLAPSKDSIQAPDWEWKDKGSLLPPVKMEDAHGPYMQRDETSTIDPSAPVPSPTDLKKPYSAGLSPLAAGYSTNAPVQELPTYTPQSGLDRTLGGIKAGLAPEIGAVKGVGSVMGSLGKSYLDKIKSGDAATITSLLAGIGAMGTAPTRSFGAALSAGLGTGAESYMAAKKAQADIGRTGAETGQVRGDTAATNLETWLTVHPKPFLGATLVKGEGAPGQPTLEYIDGSPVHWAASGAFVGAPTTSVGMVPNAVNQAVVGNTSEATSAVPTKPQSGAASPPLNGNAPPVAAPTHSNTPPKPPLKYIGDEAKGVGIPQITTFSALSPELQDKSKNEINSWKDQAAASQQNILNIDNQLEAIKRTKGTPLQSGLFEPFKQSFIAGANSIVDSIPLASPEWKEKIKGIFGNQALTAAQVADKYSKISSFIQAGNYDERSLGALQQSLAATPNMTMNSDAQYELLAKARIDEQRKADLANYADEYLRENAYGQQIISSSDINKAFGSSRNFNAAAYGQMQKNYEKFLQEPDFPQVIATLNSVRDPVLRAKYAAELDKKYNQPGFHRIIMGGIM